VTAQRVVDDELWDEFHRLVNMNSKELLDWLRTESSSERTEALPENAGPPLGHQVLAILGKRRVDLLPEDLEVMRKVIKKIHLQRGDEDLDPTVGRTRWRHRLMSMGHDPMKPIA
jgi:hypothetical protein